MEKIKRKKLFYRPAGKRKGGYTPTQIICGSFVIVIALGTFLLSLPIASRHGQLDVLDAMFTATSATCVTGLIVRDTWTQFTYFGQAVLLLLIQEDATVSACHLQTPPERRMELCRTADIIISAAGSAGVIDRAHLGRGQTIVDIGLSPGPDGELLGDVDFDAAEPLAAALTPKKGGVGAVTTAVLMAHTVEAAMRKCGLEE